MTGERDWTPGDRVFIAFKQGRFFEVNLGPNSSDDELSQVMATLVKELSPESAKLIQVMPSPQFPLPLLEFPVEQMLS